MKKPFVNRIPRPQTAAMSILKSVAATCLLLPLLTGCTEETAQSELDWDTDENPAQIPADVEMIFIPPGATMTSEEEEQRLLKEDEQSLLSGIPLSPQELNNVDTDADSIAINERVSIAPTPVGAQSSGAGNLNGKLTVKLTGKYLNGASGRIPSSIHVYFPAMNRWSTTYAARDWRLNRSSAAVTCAANKVCTATYQKVLNYTYPPNDHPFVNHPDQWDHTRLWLDTGAGRFRIEDMIMTYQPFPGRIPDTHRKGAGGHQLVWHVGISTSLNPTTHNKVSLYTPIKERREDIAEFVTGQSMSALPPILFYAARSIGKSGDLVYSMGNSGACSATMCYFQYVFGNSARFKSDFSPYWAQQTSLGQKYCARTASSSAGGGPFPNPDGSLYSTAWNKTRKLAMVYFHLDSTGRRRVSIDQNRPFLIVHRRCYGGSGACFWQIGGTSTKYQPKAGDMFFRMDRCWHGFSSSQRHAMTLTRSGTDGIKIDQNGILNVSVMEGSAMTTFGSTMMSVDNDGDGLLDPYPMPKIYRGEGPYLNDQLPNCRNGAACDLGDWFDSESGTIYKKIDIDGNGQEDMRCPRNETGFRYYYLIGESI